MSDTPLFDKIAYDEGGYGAPPQAYDPTQEDWDALEGDDGE